MQWINEIHVFELWIEKIIIIEFIRPLSCHCLSINHDSEGHLHRNCFNPHSKHMNRKLHQNKNAWYKPLHSLHWQFLSQELLLGLKIHYQHSYNNTITLVTAYPLRNCTCLSFYCFHRRKFMSFFIKWSHCQNWVNYSIRSDEGLTLETSAF